MLLNFQKNIANQSTAFINRIITISSLLNTSINNANWNAMLEIDAVVLLTRQTRQIMHETSVK